MAEILTLFPTTIYKERSRIDINMSEYEILSKWNSVTSSLGNLQSDNSKIIDTPGLLRLKEEILYHLNYYYRDIMKISKSSKIYITDSWLNYTATNKEHKMHTHTNSILSAVYFLKVNESVPFLTFTRVNPVFPLDMTSDEYNIYNSTEWNLPVNDNDIVVFPSNVWHRVMPNLTNNPRVTLAVNTFVKGSIGNKNTGEDIFLN